MKKIIGYLIFVIILVAAICVVRQIRADDKTKIGEGFNVVSSFEQFKLVGETQTETNPWNTTIGLIEDNGEQYVFMVAGTALVLDDIVEYTPFEFTYRLYYNSSNGADEIGAQSDGAGLRVVYRDKYGEIMQEDTIFIDYHAETHCYHTIPRTALSSDVRSIEIHCNSGYFGDGMWDWVVLQ